jgi:hypothetical protein
MQKFEENADIYEHEIRNINSRFVERHRTKLYECKPSFIRAKFVEKFPHGIKNCDYERIFRMKVKQL